MGGRGVERVEGWVGGQVLNTLLKSHEQIINKLGTNPKQVMNKVWTMDKT